MNNLANKLNETLGGISVPGVFHGDNLAIVLCSVFDDGGECDDETGWSEAAINGCDQTLNAIRDHYLPLAAKVRSLDELLSLAQQQRDEAYEKINRLHETLQDVIQSWDWWCADEYDRCRGVIADSIDRARTNLKGTPDE